MKLAIVISMFPEAHETFILRELVELEKQGVAFEIFSLQYPRDPVTHPDARRLMESRTHYAPLVGARALGAFVRTLLRRPRRVLRAVGTLIRAGGRQPRALVQSLGILPLTLHFAETIRARGLRHAHGHWCNVPTTACWILQMIEDLPWSAAVHGENIFTPNPLLREKLRHARFIAVCNGYSWRHLRERMGLPRPEDVHLNYHGLDAAAWRRIDELRRRPPPEKQRPVLLTIGRLVSFKGHDYLLDAFARLRGAGEELELRVIGAGPEEAALRRQAQRLGVAEDVRFLGLVPFDRVLEELHGADVFALASVMNPDGWFDGVPNVLAEAMAFGRPVVSTDASGIPELVEDGVSGRIVPQRDPAALAGAIGALLHDATERARLGAAGREKVARLFDLEANVRALRALFARYVETAGDSA